jgi:hypothetical protein
MKNNFTTPAFAKVLKEHGIEIDSCFCYIDGYKGIWAYKITGNRLWAFDIEGEMGYRDTQLTPKVKEQISPAYPLTEVLGWLPETLIEHIKPTNIPSHRPDYLSYPITSDIDDNNVLKIGYKSEYYGTKITPMPIEALITQGLTEGWLTKDNLNVNS